MKGKVEEQGTSEGGPREWKEGLIVPFGDFVDCVTVVVVLLNSAIVDHEKSATRGELRVSKSIQMIDVLACVARWLVYRGRDVTRDPLLQKAGVNGIPGLLAVREAESVQRVAVHHHLAGAEHLSLEGRHL